MTSSVLYNLFLIFAGSAIISTIVLYLRQSILLAYIFTGIVAGPDILGLVTDTQVINDISRVGVIFLLFLLGINLEVDELLPLIKKASWVTVISSIIFVLVGLSVTMLLGFSFTDSLIIGLALASSSTILGLKLLPTYELHHKHMAQMIVSILLLQDIMTIIIIVLLGGLDATNTSLTLNLLLLLSQIFISLPILTISAYFFCKVVMKILISKFDTIHEYLTILSIGWCIGIAQLFYMLGISYEIGGFVAGITLAANPIARHISETLKPVRDFFLVLFFFGIGATLDVPTLLQYIPHAFSLTIIMISIKYYTFKKLLVEENRGQEIATRIGQVSEFALLMGVVAVGANLLSIEGATLLQGVTVISFLVSSSLIVYSYPSPIAPQPNLRRD